MKPICKHILASLYEGMSTQVEYSKVIDHHKSLYQSVCKSSFFFLTHFSFYFNTNISIFFVSFPTPLPPPPSRYACFQINEILETLEADKDNDFPVQIRERLKDYETGVTHIKNTPFGFAISYRKRQNLIGTPGQYIAPK